MKAVANMRTMPVPAHLQDKHYKARRSWAMDSAINMHMTIRIIMSPQQYLPDGMEGMRFYEPSENGYEKKIREHMEFIKREAAFHG